MRKYLFINILLSGLSLGARGASPDDWETVKTSVNGLLENLPEATTAQSLRYWFDDDAGTSIRTSNVLDGSAMGVNASGLVEGIHVLHYQVVDSKGIAGIPASKLFVRISETPQAMKIRYWYDNNTSGSQTLNNLNGATTIDASSLVDGIHVLHYQIEDSKGKVYVPVSKMFFKAGAMPTAAKLRYWFDDEKTQVVEKDYSNGVQVVDASGLMDGIHTLHYQIIDNQGTAGIPVSQMFMKLATITATAILYWFDADDAHIRESAITNLSTTIDARKLEEGDHILHYQLKLSDGTLSPASSVTFDVTALLGDANGDRAVTITDAVSVVNYILGNPAEGFNIEAANVNGDFDDDDSPKITITDAVGIVNIILEGGGSSAPKLEAPDAEIEEAADPE